VESLRISIEKIQNENPKLTEDNNFGKYLKSGAIVGLIQNKKIALNEDMFDPSIFPGTAEAKAFGLLKQNGTWVSLSEKGHRFFEWLILREEIEEIEEIDLD
jgi:hypothetical protein